ncbi:MAG: hypothetical protein ACTSWL_00765 [Promethearchaeota archaeon]
MIILIYMIVCCIIGTIFLRVLKPLTRIIPEIRIIINLPLQLGFFISDGLIYIIAQICNSRIRWGDVHQNSEYSNNYYVKSKMQFQSNNMTLLKAILIIFGPLYLGTLIISSFVANWVHFSSFIKILFCTLSAIILITFCGFNPLISRFYLISVGFHAHFWKCIMQIFEISTVIIFSVVESNFLIIFELYFSWIPESLKIIIMIIALNLLINSVMWLIIKSMKKSARKIPVSNDSHNRPAFHNKIQNKAHKFFRNGIDADLSLSNLEFPSIPFQDEFKIKRDTNSFSNFE